MADLRLNVIGQDEASVTLDTVAGKVVGISKVLVDFAKSSVKASEEQAKADRQLAAVAGEATDAFKAQAAALQDSLGVSDDHVQQLQTMLLRYGEAPAEIDKTIRAIEDLSAATGRDATAALAELTSSATTGRQAFKDLGLEYQTTGSRGEVLRSATEALAKKFGGSAQTEADSLSGSVAKAKQQFGELQETIGAFLTDLIKSSGVVESATQMFKELNFALGGGEDDRFSLTPTQKKMQAVSDEIVGLKATFEDLKRSGAATDVLEHVLDQISAAKKELKELRSFGAFDGTGKADTTLNMKGVAAAKERNDNLKKIDEERARNAADANDYVLSLQRKFDEFAMKAQEDWERESDADFKRAQAEHMKEFVESKNEEVDAIVDKYKAMADAAQKQEQEWSRVGHALGGALANGVASEVEKLAAGEEMDIGDTLLSILAAILPAAGAALGSAVPGLGTMLGGTLGTVAGAALQGVARGTKKKRHSGGWANDDSMARYHAGTWVGSDEEMAVLQNGERVLSRGEVAAMGGPRGVESAVRGGQGALTINAFDAGSMREMFQGRAGRAMLNAARTGIGVPALLFGGR